MSIENNLKELTAAVLTLAENVAANTVAAGGQGTPCCADPKPEPTKKPKKAAPKKEKPAPEPEPEAPAEEVEVVTEEEDTFDRDAELNKITEFVKGVFLDPERDTKTDQDAFGKLRASYNVERAGDLPDEKLPEFYEATVKLFS